MAAEKKGGRTPRSGGARRGGRGLRARDADGELDLGTDKLYFKIGEVADIVGVATHVLRYWETEFKAIRPQKSRSQQRVYRRRDVETLLKIKHLLYEQKFTIAGARQKMDASRAEVTTATPSRAYRARQSLGRVREQLSALRQLVEDDDQFDPTGADPAAYARSRAAQGLDTEGQATLLARPDRSGDAPAETSGGDPYEQSARRR